LSSQISATNKANAQKLITALGAGSGVDVAALAQNLVDAEKAPLLNAINSKIAKNEAKISGYGAVLASMDIIKKAFQALENPSSILKPTVDIGNTFDVMLSCRILSSNVEIIADVVGPTSWVVKTLAKIL
jgi:flagellar hook-associated protein 2